MLVMTGKFIMGRVKVLMKAKNAAIIKETANKSSCTAAAKIQVDSLKRFIYI